MNRARQVLALAAFLGASGCGPVAPTSIDPAEMGPTTDRSGPASLQASPPGLRDGARVTAHVRISVRTWDATGSEVPGKGAADQDATVGAEVRAGRAVTSGTSLAEKVAYDLVRLGNMPMRAAVRAVFTTQDGASGLGTVEFANDGSPGHTITVYRNNQIVHSAAEDWRRTPDGWVLQRRTLTWFSNGRMTRRVTADLDVQEVAGSDRVRGDAGTVVGDVLAWLAPKPAFAASVARLPAAVAGAENGNWCIWEWLAYLASAGAAYAICVETIGLGCWAAIGTVIDELHNLDECLAQ